MQNARQLLFVYIMNGWDRKCIGTFSTILSYITLKNITVGLK